MAAMVKSVELVEYTFATTSGTVELTKDQDYTNCVPFMTLHGSQDYMDCHYTDVYFGGTTESGSITFLRDEVRTSPLSIKCYVVEFDPAEIKVQHGSFVNLPAAVTTAYNTPESFTQNKTAMIHHWSSTSSSRIWGVHQVRGRVLSNGTQVDMYRNRAGGTVSGHYFLFEDISAGNDHLVVDHQNKSYTGSAQDTLIPTDQRDVTRSFIITSIASSDGTASYNYRQTARVFPYLESLYRCDRGNATGTIYWATQYVTFQDTSRIYVVYQSYSSISSSNTTNTNSWSRTCNLNMTSAIPTMIMGQARGSTYNAAEIDSLFVSMKVTSGTQVTFQRNSAGYNNSTCYFGYAIVDWGGAIVSTGSNPDPLDPDISFVKSVENFRISVAAYQEQHDLSKGQDVANCALFVSQRNSSGSGEQRESLHNVWLREPGTVGALRTDAGGDGVVDVSVVEFYPDQVKVQQGKWVQQSTTTAEVAIEAVSDINKAFIQAKWETNDGSYWSRCNIRVKFTTTSGVEFYRNNSGNFVDGTFFVIEDLADNFRVTHYDTSSTANSIYHYAVEYSPFYSSLPICSFASSQNTDDVDDSTARAYAPVGGRQTWNCNATGGTRYVAFQWVRFLDERIHVAPNSPTFGTSDATINTVFNTRHSINSNALGAYNSMMSSLGRGTTTAAAGRKTVHHTYRLINSNTEIECSRETTGYTMYSSYGGMIDWIGYTHPDADEKHQLNYAYPTNSLVRSMEKVYGTDRISINYLSKGQRPENCVPFPSWRTGADLAEIVRLCRFHDIDQNSKIYSVAEGAGVGGDNDEIIYVIEFDPAQVRVQKIWYMMTGTSVNVTIPQEIDMTKTFMLFGYSVDNWGNRFDLNCITGSVTSSTELNFYRYASSAGVYLMIYLVECLQDQWAVSRVTTGSTTGANVYDYSNFINGVKGRFIQGSYSVTDTSNDCDNNTWRLYPRQDDGFQWNRQSTVGSIAKRNIEVVDFNPDLSISVGGGWFDMTSQSIETKTTKSGPLDLERSMVAPTIANDWNRVNGTTTNDASQIKVKLELTDESTITCSRYDKGANYTYGWYQWVEWPEYKTHYFEGIVTENNVPIERQVACFRADTNEMMGSTVSASGTGFYHIETTYSGTHYIVCQDDDPPVDYNHLILGKMEPYPLPTFSGGEIIYG